MQWPPPWLTGDAVAYHGGLYWRTCFNGVWQTGHSLVPIGETFPQVGQTSASIPGDFAPQFQQNCAWSSFSVLHFSHFFILTIPTF